MKVEIDVTYTFKGKLTIEANTYEEARRIAIKDFGCVLGACSASNAQVKDWNMSTHPDESLVGPIVDLKK
jgi:hypothetical protein